MGRRGSLQIQPLSHKNVIDFQHYWPTHQVGGQVNKVCIVLVDELHHGCFQQLVVELQVLSQLLQLHLLPTVCHELVNVEIILQTDRQTDI